FSEVRQMSTSSLKRFFRVTRFEDHLNLARIHALAAGAEPVDYAYTAKRRDELTDVDIWPRPVATGDDLVALGFRPGPRFKEILTRVEDEQLEGRLTTREEAIAFVRREFNVS